VYPITPTLSVAAFHERFIWLDETAVAVRFHGAVGGEVSPVVEEEPPPVHDIRLNTNVKHMIATVNTFVLFPMIFSLPLGLF